MVALLDIVLVDTYCVRPDNSGSCGIPYPVQGQRKASCYRQVFTTASDPFPRLWIPPDIGQGLEGWFLVQACFEKAAYESTHPLTGEELKKSNVLLREATLVDTVRHGVYETEEHV